MLESLFNKIPAFRPSTLLKKLQHMCFLLKFAKFVRTPFSQKTPPVVASVHNGEVYLRFSKIALIKPFSKNNA